LAEPHIPDELEELRSILISPEILVARIRPLICEILREQASSSPEELAEAIAPAVGEALRRQVKEAPESLAGALQPVIADLVKEQLGQSSGEIAAVHDAAPQAKKLPPETTDPPEHENPGPEGVSQGEVPWVGVSGAWSSLRRWLGRSGRVVRASALLLIVLVSLGGCGWWVWHVEHTFSALAMSPPTPVPSPTARPTATLTATPTSTLIPTPTLTPTPSPTALPSPSPTPRPLTLAVDRHIYELNEAFFSLLPAQHNRLVVLPYASQDQSDDALATRLASWAVHWTSQATQDAILLREEPYVVAVHPLLPYDEVTKAELIALASGQDSSCRMVVGDSGRAARELLGVKRLGPDTLVMPDWQRAKEYVATHQGTWALLPWETVDFRVRALPIDGVRPDPSDLDGYPLTRRLWLTQQVPAPQPLIDALLDAVHYEPPPIIDLVAVGDIMLDRHVREMIEENTVLYPFEGEGIRPLLSQADIAFANLECPISDRGTRQDKGYEFRAAPEVVEGLVSVGLDVLSLANNHTGDYADLALTDTMHYLDQAGIVFVGAGHNITEAHQAKIVEANGLRMAFLAYNEIGPNYFAATEDSPGSAFMEPERMVADVQAARQKADLVLVSCHWGIEYTPYPNASQQKVAQMLADAGATLIIGQHPHVAQGLRYHQNTFTTYSLGNFIFDQGFSEETSQGLALHCLLDASGIKTAEFFPVYISQCQPGVMSPEDGAPVLERVMSVTEEQDALPSVGD